MFSSQTLLRSVFISSLLFSGVNTTCAQSRDGVKVILDEGIGSVRKSEKLLAEIDNLVTFLKETEPNFGNPYDVIAEEAVHNIYQYVDTYCGTMETCREPILEIGLSLLKTSIEKKEIFDFQRFIDLSGDIT